MKLTKQEIDKLAQDELTDLAIMIVEALQANTTDKDKLRQEKLSKLSKSAELLYLTDDFMAITIEHGNVWVSDLNKPQDHLYDVDDSTIKEVLSEYIQQEYKLGNLT